MTRVLQAARLHLIHPAVMLGVPALVVSISFAFNLATWHLTPAGEDGGGFTGGVAALYITVLVVFTQAVTQLLPFAMGISFSRRSFYLGTALIAVFQSLAYGVLLSVLVSIENGTDGWGAQMSFWAPGVLDVGNPVIQVFASGAPMLACAFLGVAIGVVHQRWGQAGTWGLIVGPTVLAGAVVLLISWLDAWSEVEDWFSDQSAATFTIALPAAVALAAAVAAYPGVRRVVP